MSKLRVLLFAAGLVCAFAAQARDLATIQKTGVIMAASEGQFKPFNYFEGKKLTGYEIEVMEAVAKKMGLKVEWKALGFDALIAAVKQDRFDLAIASHGITPERQKSVDFADPHYCTGGQIIAKEGGPMKVADLKDKVIGVQLATSYADAARKLPGIKEVKTLKADTDVQQALIAGRVDAWITDRFVGRDSIAANPNAKLKAGDMVFVERVALITKKDNKALLDALNKALAEAKADGTLKAISEKYFKEDINCQ